MFEEYGKLVDTQPLYMFKDKIKPESQTWILVFDTVRLTFDTARHRPSRMTSPGYVTIFENGSEISWFEHHTPVLIFEKQSDSYQQCLDNLTDMLIKQFGETEFDWVSGRYDNMFLYVRWVHKIGKDGGSDV